VFILEEVKNLIRLLIAYQFILRQQLASCGGFTCFGEVKGPKSRRFGQEDWYEVGFRTL